MPDQIPERGRYRETRGSSCRRQDRGDRGSGECTLLQRQATDDFHLHEPLERTCQLVSGGWEGVDVLCRQIAGAVARRIVTYAKEGEECYIDEHLGFIKLGSRVDVYLPLGTEVCVKMGQSTTGDQTIIAKLK